MSACANPGSRRILQNITNMEDQEAEGVTEKPSIVDVTDVEALAPVADARRRIEIPREEVAVSQQQQPTATTLDPNIGSATPTETDATRPTRTMTDRSEISPSIVAPPTGDNSDSRCRSDEFNGTYCSKPFIRTRSKFESGSGSGDQDGIMSMEDCIDIATKKRKTRRGKPKHRKLKPYSKQHPGSYQQRLRCRAISRPTKPPRQPPAPYNTTQFLIEDHNDLPELEQKLKTVAGLEIPTASFQKPIAPSRTRDSSFSVDSDEDFFYSSPEDEEEFLTKEFSTAYDDLHIERLGMMTKCELLQEYIQMETKVDALTKRLKAKTLNNDEEKNEPKFPNDVSKKLKIFQQRIDDLIRENEILRRQNDILKKQRHASPMSSIDSESDSDTGSFSNGNRSSCSCTHKSTGSSPVPASYQARRKKAPRKSSSVSSIDSESDSSTTGSSVSHKNKKVAEPTVAMPMDIPNGLEISNQPLT